ncbi:MAG: polysaccharide biosynthesis C-terminal domain-containing protein [Bacteroidetes bacterium]|nr:polysaccharide biosynthesis C-terminal domain-containing protein [Bacteroidota bacterium]MBS1539997.1 polysaccharide biosynthesis C-terminal domain-containing protein [Bacteroidota bacterium]
MSKIKKLAGETVIYGLGNILPRFLNFLLVPIHTSFFHAEEYGIYTKLMALVGVLNILYSFGMETAFFRFTTKEGADPKKIFNIAQTAVTGISTVLTALLIFFSAGVAKLLSVEGHENFIVWLALIMFVDNVVSIPFARLRLEKKPLQFAFFRVSNVMIQIGLTLYFLYVVFDPAMGIAYLFLANLIANGFYLLFFAKTFFTWRPAYDRAMFSSMIGYAYPIMLTGLAGMMNEFFSRIALDKWLPDNFYPGKTAAFAVGVFGVCYKLSVFMNLTVQAFRMAAEPFFFSHATDRNSPQLFARVNHYFIIVCCFILLAVSINLDWLKILFLRKEEYWVGLSIVPPLLLGYLFLGVYYNFSVWFKLTDRTYFGTIITLGGALLTLLLNYLLIPVAGYQGSSWATVIVYGAMMVVCYGLGQKYFPIPYFVWIDAGYIAGTYLLLTVVNSISFSTQLQATTFQAATMLLFLVFVYAVERTGIRQQINGQG